MTIGMISEGGSGDVHTLSSVNNNSRVHTESFFLRLLFSLVRHTTRDREKRGRER